MAGFISRYAACCRLAGAILVGLSSGATWAQNPVNGYGPVVEGGSVLALAQGDDGSMLLGGQFNSVNQVSRNRVALVKADGSINSQFNPNVGNGIVYTVLSNSDGDYVLAGSFTTVGGVTRTRMAWFDAFGQPVVGTSSPAPNSTVRTMIEDPDSGKLYIGGQFSQVGGQTRHRVARLQTNGNLDGSFNPPAFDGSVLALALQPDGKLIIAGSIQRVGDIGVRRLYRLNADGSWDSSFSVTNPADGTIRSVALQQDGRILVGGDFSGHLRRYMPNGALDMDYAPPNLNSPVRSIDLQADGRAVIGGEFTLGVGGRQRIARLHEDGSVDAGFAPLTVPNDTVHVVRALTDGTTVFGGDFTSISSFGRLRVARLTDQGGLDVSLAVTGTTTGEVHALARDRFGNLLVGGQFSRINGVSRTNLARLAPSGLVQGSFAPILDGRVETIAVQPDGSILIGGAFSTVNGQPRVALARLNTDGSLDTNFNPEFQLPVAGQRRVAAMHVLDDGKLLVAGNFSGVNGFPSKTLARLLPSGAVDTAFSTSAVELYWLEDKLALNVDVQGRILIGGDSLTVGGVSRNLVRLLANGSLDSSYNPVVDGPVRALSTRSTTTMIGGEFETVAGQPRYLAAALSGTGTLLPFNPVTPPPVGSIPPLSTAVRSIVPRFASGIFVGGAFDTVQDQTRDNLAQLLDSGALESSFSNPGIAGTGFEPGIHTTLVEPDGRLVIAGDFSSVKGQPRRSVARLRLATGRSSDRLLWDQNNGLLTWMIPSSSINPRILGRPRVMVSQSCCNPNSFVPADGGGLMSQPGQSWTLSNLDGLPGKFYVRIDYRSGDPKGSGTSHYSSPIRQLIGPEPPLAQADLSLAKQVSPAQASVNQQVEFRLTAANLGPGAATGVAVSYKVPSGYQYDSHNADAGVFDPTTGVWSIGSMAAGASANLVVRANVRQSGEYLSFAAVTGDQFDPVPGNNLAEAAVTVLRPQADLELVKTVSPAQAGYGQTVVFEVSLENLGPDSATGIRVSDKLPVGYAYLNHQASQGSFDADIGAWDVGSLGESERALLEISASVNTTGPYLNTAAVIANEEDPNLDNNIDSAAVTLTPTADTAIEKTVEPSTAPVGSTVEFSLLVDNFGPDIATAILVEDELPAGYSYLGHSLTQGNFDPALGQWSVGTLAPTERARLVIQAMVNPSGPYLNTATVQSTQFDPLPGNNSASAAVGVPAPNEADLQLTKSVNPAQSIPGGVVSFFVDVINDGPDEADNVSALDQLPSGYSYVSHVTSKGDWDPATGVWTIGNLDPDEEVGLRIEAAVQASGSHLNVASVESSANDPDLGNNSDSAAVVVLPPPEPDGSISPVSFDGVPVGDTSAPEAAIVTSSGKASLLIYGPATLPLNPGAAFAIASDACDGQSLSSGQTCQVSVTCAPTAVGAISGTLRLPSNAGPLNAQLSCNGVEAAEPDLIVQPRFGPIGLGADLPGSTSSVAGSITNQGDATGQFSCAMNGDAALSVAPPLGGNQEIDAGNTLAFEFRCSRPISAGDGDEFQATLSCTGDLTGSFDLSCRVTEVVDSLFSDRFQSVPD